MKSDKVQKKQTYAPLCVSGAAAIYNMELYSTAVGGAPEQRKTKEKYYAMLLDISVFPITLSEYSSEAVTL